MTDKKEQTMLELASDDSAMQLLRSIAHNWEVAASRMEQINQERDQALYDDDGVEVMAVFCRLERVGSMMFSMLSHPQALQLRGFHQQIVKMAADHRLDRELVTMMGSQSEGLSIGVPTLWKRLKDIFDKGVKETDEGMDTVQSLYQQHYIPHMDAEQALRAMESVVKRDEGETPDNRLLTMRSSVKEMAERIEDLSDDKYYSVYEHIWEDIVQSPVIGAQLADYRNGKHNNGFNMQCFCQIVGWLNREKHFFGSSSPTDLGKKLGDKYSWETYRDYIKKTKIDLTALSIKELMSILDKYSKK